MGESEAVINYELSQDEKRAYLIIRNDGEADAHNVHIFFEGMPITKHGVFPKGHPVPPATIVSGGQTELMLEIIEGVPDVAELTLVWEDESSTQRSATYSVNLVG